MAWIGRVLESEFFWGIIAGLLLSIVGSYFLAFFAARQQRKERKAVLKSFCVDTVTNIRQIVDDMNATRKQTNNLKHSLALLDIENEVFGHNREQLADLPSGVRDNVRKFVTDCAIRGAEIGNRLTTFNNRVELADQYEAQGNGDKARDIRRDATNGPLARANRALDELGLRARDSDGVIGDVVSVR
jgi:hypothetical protein